MSNLCKVYDGNRSVEFKVSKEIEPNTLMFFFAPIKKIIALLKASCFYYFISPINRS